MVKGVDQVQKVLEVHKEKMEDLARKGRKAKWVSLGLQVYREHRV